MPLGAVAGFGRVLAAGAGGGISLPWLWLSVLSWGFLRAARRR